MHASVNVGCQGKSGPGKIHEVILVQVQPYSIAEKEIEDTESHKNDEL